MYSFLLNFISINSFVFASTEPGSSFISFQSYTVPVASHPQGVQNLNSPLIVHCLVFKEQLKEVNLVDKKLVHCFSRSIGLVQQSFIEHLQCMRHSGFWRYKE